MFLWPPRPEKRVHPDALPVFDRLGWQTSVKLNGTCTVISFDPGTGQFEAWTRHKEPHKLWTPDLNSPCLRSLKQLQGGLYVLVGELLHSKVPSIRDTLYLFDILIADGRSMIGITLRERNRILHGLWLEHPGVRYNIVDERLWTSNLLTGPALGFFNDLKAPEDEGLVLKNPNAKLDPCYHPSANTSWQVKCRRPKTMYAY